MKTLLILFFLVSCSSARQEKSSKKINERDRSDKLLEESVRIENEVFQLVGCTMIKKIEATTKNAKRLPYEIRQKAKDIGGNVLNDLAVRERYESQGETIFQVGQKEYLASADVYRCQI